MLESLRVKNVALIDEAEVEFKSGLNILTGETGAGKSILIGSINLALGAKADKSMIRTGEEFAFVELVFSVTSKSQKERLEEMDVYPDDNQIILQRRILSSRNVCKVNGETITNKTLREIGEILLDIHGQHEHQSLLLEKKQAEILDSFCGQPLFALKEQLKEQLVAYREQKQELMSLNLHGSNKEKELSLAQFEFQEITDADLKDGEDKELEQSYHKMSNARKITEGVSKTYELMNGSDGESVLSLFSKGIGEIHSLIQYDETLQTVLEEMINTEDMLRQAAYKLDEYIRNFSFNEREYAQITERLNLINHIKSKYGNTFSEIISYANYKEKEINKLMDLDSYRENLLHEFEKSEQAVLFVCQKITDMRQKQAQSLSKELEQALLDLNFADVNFKIMVEPKAEPGIEGMDAISFQISLNPGEPLKPLSSVASGGELSRVMLALKTVLAEKDKTETLIFDEIDAGISGRTAWKVSEKLGILGKKHQVLCITHLPQIAAMADTHFVIEKCKEGQKVMTTIRPLKEKETYDELARLLGGDEISKKALENAKELKETAKQAKKI